MDTILCEARFASLEKELEKVRIQLDGSPPSIANERVESLRSLHDEKFRNIQVQFQERDVRTDAALQTAKVSVDAALQAAKEAVSEQNKAGALALAKSEATTSKQIDQQGQVLATTTEGLNGKIDDLKQRMTLAEGARVGGAEIRTTQDRTSGFVLGVVGAIIGAAGLIAAVLTLVLHR